MAQHGKTLVADAARVPRLLFASYHCYLDPSSGAAIATRDLLELLASHGWQVRVFCGPRLDFERGESLAQLLSDQGIAFEERRFPRGGTPSPPAPLPRTGEGSLHPRPLPQTGEGSLHPDPLPKGEGSSVGTAGFSLLDFRQNGVPVSVFAPAGPNRSVPSPGEGAAFLALFERILDEYRPDILLTYGGHWLASGLMARARERGAAVVFALHNFEYRDARLFQHTSAVLVPSKFCAEHYQRTLGLDCTAIPSPLNWSRVRCERSDAKQYVTFVNPQPNKGVFVFVRIAHELGRRRPDIPLLIVEGRGGVNWLARTGLDLSGLGNMSAMANTPDPRDFYCVSRVVLMPSLWRESFGRAALPS